MVAQPRSHHLGSSGHLWTKLRFLWCRWWDGGRPLVRRSAAIMILAKCCFRGVAAAVEDGDGDVSRLPEDDVIYRLSLSDNGKSHAFEVVAPANRVQAGDRTEQQAGVDGLGEDTRAAKVVQALFDGDVGRGLTEVVDQDPSERVAEALGYLADADHAPPDSHHL